MLVEQYGLNEGGFQINLKRKHLLKACMLIGIIVNFLIR